MGKEFTGLPGLPTLKNQGSPNPRGTRHGARGTEGNGTPGNPRPGSAPGNDPGTRTPGNPAGKAEEKKPVGLADVSGQATVNKTSAKPTEVPANSGLPTPEAPQKKQRRQSKPRKKNDPQAVTADQLSALILTTSAIVASRPGFEVWALKPNEAAQLATPLANMVKNSEKMKELSEHADAVALVTASLIIFGPRAFMFADQNKKKKLEKNGGLKLVRKEAESASPNRRPAEPGPAHGPESPSTLDEAIPSVVW